MESMYLQKRRSIALGLEAPPQKKEQTPLRQVSEKKKAKDAEEKKQLKGDDTFKEKWFQARRKRLVGTCQCGCGRPSQKKDDLYFRHSICHIFPKAIFESVALHPLNQVERAFFGGCHTNMDEGGLDKWPNMADWEDIREKFFVLAPLLTEEERAKKFYSHLEKLVYADAKKS